MVSPPNTTTTSASSAQLPNPLKRPHNEISSTNAVPASPEQSLTTDDVHGLEAEAVYKDFPDFNDFIPSDFVRFVELAKHLESCGSTLSTALHELLSEYAARESKRKQVVDHNLKPHVEAGSVGVPESSGLDPVTGTVLTVSSPNESLEIAQKLRLQISMIVNNIIKLSSELQETVAKAADDTDVALSRSSAIEDKLKLIAIPSRDPTPVPVVKEQPRQIKLRVNHDPSAHPAASRPEPRIAYGTAQSSTDASKRRKSIPAKPRTPKGPPVDPLTCGGAPSVDAQGNPIPSEQLPWNQLTNLEYSLLRKKMKKNHSWIPSVSMIARELELLGRGPANKDKECYKSQWEGKDPNDLVIAPEDGGIGETGMTVPVKEKPTPSRRPKKQKVAEDTATPAKSVQASASTATADPEKSSEEEARRIREEAHENRKAEKRERERERRARKKEEKAAAEEAQKAKEAEEAERAEAEAAAKVAADADANSRKRKTRSHTMTDTAPPPPEKRQAVDASSDSLSSPTSTPSPVKATSVKPSRAGKTAAPSSPQSSRNRRQAAVVAEAAISHKPQLPAAPVAAAPATTTLERRRSIRAASSAGLPNAQAPPRSKRASMSKPKESNTGKASKGKGNAVALDPEGDSEDRALYCMCRQPSGGFMVQCENDGCVGDWFHPECLGLKIEDIDDTKSFFCPPCAKKLGKRPGVQSAAPKKRKRSRW